MSTPSKNYLNAISSDQWINSEFTNNVRGSDTCLTNGHKLNTSEYFLIYKIIILAYIPVPFIMWHVVDFSILWHLWFELQI